MTSHNSKKSNWRRALPSSLKLVFCQLKNNPIRTFRVLHLPDRPAKDSPSHVILTDDECLQHLLYLQGQARYSLEPACRWQDPGAPPSLHGVDADGNFVRPTKELATGLNPGRLGWDAVVTKPVGPPFTQDSSIGRVCSNLLQLKTLSSRTSGSGIVHPSEPSAVESIYAQRALTCRTWHSSRTRRSTVVLNSKDTWAPRISLSPSPRNQSEMDSEDDAYDGLADYYFDESNYPGQDPWGGLITRVGASTHSQSMDGFF